MKIGLGIAIAGVWSVIGTTAIWASKDIKIAIIIVLMAAITAAFAAVRK